MPEVLVSTDSITVVGPPNTVELLVDIGPAGIRGNRFIVGSGDPDPRTDKVNDILDNNTLIFNDMYINIAAGSDYGYLYQYVSKPGGKEWIQVLDINPAIYSETHLTTYVAGTAQISIPISNITSATGLTAENFNIQYSIAYSNPLASSMSIPALAGAGTNLVINFNAVEYDDDSGPAEWIALDGTVTTHLFISIVAGIDES
jgi:hypothetical protein